MQPLLIIGPRGSGKTTAVKSISQLVKPDEVAVVRPRAITTEDVYSYKNKKLIIVEEIESDSDFYKAMGHVNAICMLNQIKPLIIYTTQNQELVNIPDFTKLHCSSDSSLYSSRTSDSLQTV